MGQKNDGETKQKLSEKNGDYSCRFSYYMFLALVDHPRYVRPENLDKIQLALLSCAVFQLFASIIAMQSVLAAESVRKMQNSNLCDRCRTQPGLTSQRHSALISSDSEQFQVCFSAVHYLKISEQR